MYSSYARHPLGKFGFKKKKKERVMARYVYNVIKAHYYNVFIYQIFVECLLYSRD